jgi:hypothetical protein
MALTLTSAISRFGAEAKRKLSNPSVTGQPEDQLRAPFEQLIHELSELTGFRTGEVTAVGESSLSDLKTRPDYAVTVRNILTGFVELKSPGKGADPRKFRERHDKEQWQNLQSIPNLIYTDGNQFSLWRDGELQGEIVSLVGDIETSGSSLAAPHDLLSLFENFIRWQPIPPRSAKELATTSARLCRLLRAEVTEQLSLGSVALTAVAIDWRKLLFPDATDAQFADGYAQAVTFGLLMARARDIRLTTDLHTAARHLQQTNSLIGTALDVLTHAAQDEAALQTSLGTLVRVLNVVHWPTISKGDPDAWLYFYEDFLEVYDNVLRKKTGSYYTPPEVVNTMVRLVDEALAKRFSVNLTSPAVTIADPAVGTGTFLLGVFRKIAGTVEDDEGEGAVAAAVEASVNRIIAFEMQLGPFAVAQLRLLAEISHFTNKIPPPPPRMFVADTLSDPYGEPGWLPEILRPIGESRQEANRIKRDERIKVVIGNPPYKEKAKGLGGWVESGSTNSPERPPLEAWVPPPDWGVSAHAKHLRNLYVYFWRWATWKVFDHDPSANTGIVCFITVAGFLNGPGFQRMRDYLRHTANEIWVIDCSPEGHQPEVNTRIFQGVQQPICIVLASRPTSANNDEPAVVRFRALAKGDRKEKFKELGKISLDDGGWVECPSDWRAPFLPESKGAWSNFPALEDFFLYNGSGVMPGRTWIIAPDAQSVEERWQTLIDAPAEVKESLFHPHLRGGQPGDKHTKKVVKQPLYGFAPRPTKLAEESGASNQAMRYAFRSFDRQWIIPDSRLINQPNPELWASFSPQQVFLTALTRTSPKSGPALTVTGLIPDLDHYKGSFGGRVFPLWRDRKATTPNVRQDVLQELSRIYSFPVSAEDLFAYMAAVAAHPEFTKRFKSDLVQPGLRIPLTADGNLFSKAAELGRIVIWLHTFGERFVDAKAGRSAGPPRLPPKVAPRIPVSGAIPTDSKSMPDNIEYDEGKRRLLVGNGYIENVTPEMWNYEVSGKHVLRQWFSYRKANRERPVIGDRRQPSKLGDIQPDHWLAEYTTELLNVLNVLGGLIELEPTQADLLQEICEGPLIPKGDLAQVMIAGEKPHKSRKQFEKQSSMIDH